MRTGYSATLSAVATRGLLRKALCYKFEGLLGRHGCPADALGRGFGSDLDAAVLGVKQFADPPIDAQLEVETLRVLGAGLYLAIVIVAAELMPTVNEIGDFPADILWGFRRSSLTTLATMWGTIGLVLVGLVGRKQEQAAVVNARRELAASL